jgi:FdrA protein
MMLEGLRALQEDPATEVITLISKPPSSSITQKILAQVANDPKPTVICFLGGQAADLGGYTGVIPSRTLEEAALLAAQAVGGDLAQLDDLQERSDYGLRDLAGELRAALGPDQRAIRGLYSGGSLCYEAQVIWKEMLDVPVFSNAPLPGGLQLADSMKSQGHSAIDLGEEEFTVGRPHPMIDNDLRLRRIKQEAADPETAVLILDVVIGYGAHPDPASELGPAIADGRETARTADRGLVAIASVTGTEEDPQGFSATVTTLENYGVVVCDSHASAARLAALVVS